MSTAYNTEFRNRIRAIHQAAHPELWPHLQTPADPAAVLNLTGRCLADMDDQPCPAP